MLEPCTEARDAAGAAACASAGDARQGWQSADPLRARARDLARERWIGRAQVRVAAASTRAAAMTTGSIMVFKARAFMVVSWICSWVPERCRRDGAFRVDRSKAGDPILRAERPLGPQRVATGRVGIFCAVQPARSRGAVNDSFVTDYANAETSAWVGGGARLSRVRDKFASGYLVSGASFAATDQEGRAADRRGSRSPTPDWMDTGAKSHACLRQDLRIRENRTAAEAHAPAAVTTACGTAYAAYCGMNANR